MSTATDGRRREHQVSHHMQDYGWRQITRAAGSKGPVDLWMLHDQHGAACIQVKSSKGSLGPQNRRDLCDIAEAFNATPVLARIVPRQPIEYLHVHRELSQWTTWTP